MKRPIIFLDMDGVLSSPRAWITRPGDDLPDRWIDIVAVKLLNLICAESGAVVVVSSTWRLTSTRDAFIAMMARNGFTGQIAQDWRTKDLRDGDKRRGDEVAEWLERHPETGSYVILDDNSDFADGQPLVLTDSYNGLLLQHYQRAMEILLGRAHKMVFLV